jgi:hypothetical protein
MAIVHHLCVGRAGTRPGAQGGIFLPTCVYACACLHVCLRVHVFMFVIMCVLIHRMGTPCTNVHVDALCAQACTGLCMRMYVCVHGQRTAGLGAHSTFCPSVPFLPARPGAPWKGKERGSVSLYPCPLCMAGWWAPTPPGLPSDRRLQIHPVQEESSVS